MAGAEPAGQIKDEKNVYYSGTKFISKLRYISKFVNFGPLSENKLSKKCTPLGHEAYFDINISKLYYIWINSNFGKIYIAIARNIFPKQSIQIIIFLC